MMHAPLRVLFVLVLVATARLADATTIVVSPGPGTPVQDAIDAAAPGDKIRLLGGGYPEASAWKEATRTHGNLVDVSDDGTGNCWAKNSFATGTVPGCP